jgi:hypothetical protein
MRAGVFVAVLVFLFLTPQPVDAAACKAGETVTLQGEIIILPVFDAGEWFWSGKFAQTPCQVTTLRGKGALPPECVVGKRMTLTGRVREDGILILEVMHIRCF